jgi:uncharacterized membrane protein required for colicin V production
MSWVDLGAVAIMLWGAAKGYLNGASQMFLHVLGFCVALFSAMILQRPFTAYLNQEWQAEAIIVGLFTRNAEQLLKTGTAPAYDYKLPELVGAVMRWMSNEPDTVAVIGQETATAIISRILVSFSALTVVFVFFVVGIMLILRIRHYRIRNRVLPEWQRLLGMLVGITHGLGFSLVLCVIMDAMSMFRATAFLEQDLSISYLYQAMASILQYM